MPDGPRSERHEDERLSAFLDDELSDDEALVVTRHLARCDDCVAELDGIRRARAALRRLPNLEPPPALFVDAAFTAAVADPGWPATWPLGARLLVAGLLATFGIGAAAFAAGGDPEGTVAPPVELFVVDHVLRVGGGPVITAVDLGDG